MNKAGVIFSQVPRNCNCAQAVAAGCGHEELVDELKNCGGGRAPEGRCGALHAALQLVPADRRAAVCEAFRAKAGSEKCAEIRPAGVFPCLQCVILAADLAETNK